MPQWFKRNPVIRTGFISPDDDISYPYTATSGAYVKGKFWWKDGRIV